MMRTAAPRTGPRRPHLLGDMMIVAGRHFRGFDIAMAAGALVACAVSIALAPGALGWAGAGLAVLMAAIAIVDARRFVIPDVLVASSFALALLHAELQVPDWSLAPLVDCVVRGAALAVVLQALRLVYMRLRGRHGLGFGDVKLAAVAGAWLDWQIIPIAVEIAALAALAAYVVRQMTRGRAMRATGMLPFGLFFAPAIWFGWLVSVMLFYSNIDIGILDWAR